MRRYFSARTGCRVPSSKPFCWCVFGRGLADGCIAPCELWIDGLARTHHWFSRPRHTLRQIHVRKSGVVLNASSHVRRRSALSAFRTINHRLRTFILVAAWFFVCNVTNRACGQEAKNATSKAPQIADRKPNIILILADDLGYGDLGCYGQSIIRTTRLDQLAREGMRFTDHYAGSTIGAPSRCCLLTGQHTGHSRIRGNSNVLLAAGDVTVAKLLKQTGYVTGAIGKWGVGHPPPPGDPAANGFDYFYGYLDKWHAHNYFPDFLWKNNVKCSIKGNVVKPVDRGGVAIKQTQYSHNLFTQEAVAFITEHRSKPFFLYVPFTIPHANIEAGEKGMEVPNDVPYTEQNWPEPQRHHASMITRLDHSVGRIVDQLKMYNLDKNTLLIFASDNGPHGDGGADPNFFKSSGGLRGQKGKLYEGGIRVPMIAWWPGKIPPGTVRNHVSSFWDFLPTACEVAGAKPPKSTDGISYLPTLLGKSDEQVQHRFLYWEYHERGSKQAIRMGPWKAVKFVGGDLQLYNLVEDIGETTNVADKQPEVVRKIKVLLKDARVDSELFPLKPDPSATSSVKKSSRRPRRFE